MHVFQRSRTIRRLVLFILEPVQKKNVNHFSFLFRPRRNDAEAIAAVVMKSLLSLLCVKANDARVDKDLSGGPSPFDVSERMTTQVLHKVWHGTDYS